MASASSGDAIFRIKHVHYKGNQVPMLMQNLNGPCPLLAISKAAPALVAIARPCARRGILRMRCAAPLTTARCGAPCHAVPLTAKCAAQATPCCWKRR